MRIKTLLGTVSSNRRHATVLSTDDRISTLSATLIGWIQHTTYFVYRNHDLQQYYSLLLIIGSLPLVGIVVPRDNGLTLLV